MLLLDAELLEQIESWFWDQDFIRGIIVPLCHIGTGSTVLDVGCGTGAFGRQLSRYLGPEGRVTGIDTDEDAIHRGQEFNRTRGYSNMELLALDARDLTTTMPQRRFDVVVEAGVLNCIPDNGDMNAALQQMTGLVRPGGYFCSLGMEYKAFVREAFDEFEADHNAWWAATYRGAGKLKGVDTRVEVRVPNLLYEYGMDDIKVKLYMPPIRFPPYSNQDIELRRRDCNKYDVTHEDHKKLRPMLAAGGLSDGEIDRIAGHLVKYWQMRVDRSRANQPPPLYTQVFPVTIARKPPAGPAPQGAA